MWFAITLLFVSALLPVLYYFYQVYRFARAIQQKEVPEYQTSHLMLRIIRANLKIRPDQGLSGVGYSILGMLNAQQRAYYLNAEPEKAIDALNEYLVAMLAMDAKASVNFADFVIELRAWRQALETNNYAVSKYRYRYHRLRSIAQQHQMEPRTIVLSAHERLGQITAENYTYLKTMYEGRDA